MDILLIVLNVPFFLPFSVILGSSPLLRFVFLTIQLQCYIIVIKSLFKLAKFIKASSPSQKSIHMSGIKLNYNGKILNSILHLIQFLMRAANKIVGINISTINVKKGMAVLNSIQILFFLHKGARTDEKSLFVVRIRFQFQSANCY